MALTAQELGLALDRRMVLEGITTAFRPGRVTAVLGANGAGKSTLLRVLAGLIRPGEGRVLLDGRDLATLPARARAQAIGYLPQEAAVHWNMRVRDLVALGRVPHRDRGAAAITAALAATDTAGFANRPVRALSGGEQARVLLARVLAGEPRWLLADEPLANLDPLHQLRTLALLRAAAASGIGVIVVLHDLTLAAQVADEGLLLAAGRILGAGPAAEVITEANIAAAYGVAVAIVSHPGGRAIVPLDRP